MSLHPRERLIVALDFPVADEALRFVESLGDTVTYYKVGLELFSAVGPEIVKKLKSMGKYVFLDLKFHDIPNTVAGAAARAVAMGADIFNVHVLGGMAMMRAAIAAASQTAQQLGCRRPTIVGVTVLTSFDQDTLEREVGVILPDGIGAYVTAKARQAKQAGLDGVVASPREIQDVRSACGDEFQIITPGVRPAWASSDDQKRVATPSQALQMGADRIVVGRPITRAASPLAAVEQILSEIS
ncbi:MAG: orotidine-5'-phosphate decarboxylase [Candidatus Abyssubacteria bacterium]